MSQHATAADFVKWAEKAKTMTDAELVWSTRDAFQASRLLDKVDGTRAGYYADEGHTYNQELNNRRKGK